MNLVGAAREPVQERLGLLAVVGLSIHLPIEHDLAEEASNSYFILSDASFHRDRYADALDYLRESIAFSRRIGNRPYEWSALAESTYALFMLGRWDEALEVTDELREEQVRSGGMFLSLLSGPLEIHLHRGELANVNLHGHNCGDVSIQHEPLSDSLKWVILRRLGAGARV